MPPRPHLPFATLRYALCYPVSRRTVTQAQIEAGLRLVDLEHLIAQLDEKVHWKNTLTSGEQQRPQWIFLDECFDALTFQDGERMLRIIDEELPGATLLVTTHMPDRNGHFSRRLSL